MTPEEENIIQKTAHFVQATLENAEGGHDWWHIQRVWNLANRIAEKEAADEFVVALGALLHDIADAKFHNGDETIGPKKAKDFLYSLQVNASTVEHVVNIIEHISFKGGNHTPIFYSKELAIVQDADRLDALGAIGIARTFNYGGYKNRAIYDPNIKPNLNKTKEEYKNSNTPTINHFYEKLLLLKDRMNTATGKAMATHRHHFLELFLEEFYSEWEGKL
jgi:uncharacterized protein